MLTDAIGEEVAALLPGLLGLAAVILAIGCLLSLLLARRVKRQTLGLEPQEITTLYAHHDATLHALREGVVVFDEHAARRWSTTTPSACWATRSRRPASSRRRADHRRRPRPARLQPRRGA